MVSPSAIINKSFRTHVVPVLRSAGFEKVDARNGWAWRTDCVWVFNIRAVGRYFAGVTGWPPASVGAWLGVRYSFIPAGQALKADAKGRLLPAESQCHMRSHLERRLSQHHRVTSLTNAAERSRKDIWWLEPDGTNAEEVARDIAACVAEVAVPWFLRCSDLAASLAAVEAERDCFNKFVLAAYLSGKVGNAELRDKYTRLAEEEGKRIGVAPETQTWFPLLGR